MASEGVYAVGRSRMAGLSVWIVVSQKAGLFLPGGVSEKVVSLMLVATGLKMVAHGVYKSGTGKRGLLSAAQVSQLWRKGPGLTGLSVGCMSSRSCVVRAEK